VGCQVGLEAVGLEAVALEAVGLEAVGLEVDGPDGLRACKATADAPPACLADAAATGHLGDAELGATQRIPGAERSRLATLGREPGCPRAGLNPDEISPRFATRWCKSERVGAEPLKCAY